MNPSSQQPNERLLNDAMSTPSLESFYDNVENQIVGRMATDSSSPSTTGRRRLLIGLGASALILILATVVTLYVRNSDVVQPTIVTPKAPNTQRGASDVPPQQPTFDTKRGTTPIAPIEPPKAHGGSTSESSISARSESSAPLSVQTQHDVDSLESALRSAATTSDAARIGYQLGVRLRVAGKNDKALGYLMNSANAAKSVGASVLAARAKQQAAKASADLNNSQQAINLYEQALILLPKSEQVLHERWTKELDSLKH